MPRLATNYLLAPRRVFLDYPPSQKGYRCLDLSNHKNIISRHVVFDETHFLFVASKPRPDSFDFLLQDIIPAPALSTSDVEQTRPSDDAGDPVGLDPAILWDGAAYRLSQQEPRPATTAGPQAPPSVLASSAPRGPATAAAPVTADA